MALTTTKTRPSFVPHNFNPTLIREYDIHGIVGKTLDLSAAGATVNDTDGMRVLTNDGWWLLRASNTQAVLIARAESKP